MSFLYIKQTKTFSSSKVKNNKLSHFYSGLSEHGIEILLFKMFLLTCEEKLEADVKENLTLVKSHFIYF